MSVPSQARAPEASGQPAPAGWLPCLDAYRVIGSVVVLLYHGYGYALVDFDGVPKRILDRGDSVLGLFFVMSAFLLFRPIYAALMADRPLQGPRPFLRNRVLRIFPPYWFLLICAVPLFGVTYANFRELATFALLLQPYRAALVLSPRFQPLYQSWYLAAEIALAVLTLIVAFGLRRVLLGRSAITKLRAVFGVIVVFYLTGNIFRFICSRSDWPNSASLWLPSWLDLVAFGMALAVAHEHARRTGRLPQPLDVLARFPALSWAISLAVFAVPVAMHRPIGNNLNTNDYPIRWFFYGISVTLFVLPALIGDQDQGVIRKVLRSRVFRLGGMVSLGFFLFHMGWLGVAQDWLNAPDFRADYVRLIAIAFPLSVISGIASYLLIERPLLRLKAHRAPVPLAKEVS